MMSLVLIYISLSVKMACNQAGQEISLPFFAQNIDSAIGSNILSETQIKSTKNQQMYTALI
jgi:hypothetical protein